MGLPGFVTTPPSYPGDQLNPVVYNVPLAGQITTSAAVNLITAPANGTYRITVACSQTILGVGTPGTTTFIPSVIFTDPNASGTSTVTMATFATGATNGALGYIAAASGVSSLLFRAKSGTAIQMSVAGSGGGGTTNPTVVITPIIESLGQ